MPTLSAESSMLLLHISDIHFKSPDCLDPFSDPERQYRTTLINDVRRRVNDLGLVDALIVTGDIAYKAAPEEYKTAMEWLIELAGASGCVLERVFVVPGNHDVNREIIKQTPAIRNAQKAIADAADIEGDFNRQIRDKETGQSLFQSMQAYNEFAKHFNCQVHPDRLDWRQELDLGDGVLLRLYGLTSTLLSGAIRYNGSQDDSARENLYLSPRQMVLDPVANVVNAALSHHPPEWFRNCDDVEDALNERAKIQFLGHKHRRRVTRDPQYLRLSAGAVNPDRQEPGWQPGYNFVDICVSGSDAHRTIRLKVTSLAWQDSPDMFRPTLDPQGNEVFEHFIAFPDYAAVVPDVGATPAAAFPAEIVAEVAMSSTSTRNLIRRFWKLSVSERLNIALSMELIQESEKDRPELERYSGIFKLANERNVLDQLVQEIERVERT